VPVRAADTSRTLAARVLKQEHRVYPLALRWFVEGRLVLENVWCALRGWSKPIVLAEE